MDKQLSPKERGELMLYDIILALRDIDEAKAFFRDLLTPEEIEEFSKRWEVAKLLNDGLPYSFIERTTGLSSTTIARVSKWLNGKGGGYKTMMSRRRNTTHHHHSKQRLENDL